jgi:hypothetical protein
MRLKSQADFDADFDAYSTSRPCDDGAAFSGREIDFVTDQKVITS